MRKKEVEIAKHVSKVNPIKDIELKEYDLVIYTDGACKKQKGDPIGSAAYIVYNKEGL